MGLGWALLGWVYKTHLSIKTHLTNLFRTQTQPNPIIMGKPQLTQLPNYQNYQNTPKVKNSILTTPPSLMTFFGSKSEFGKFHQISKKKKKKITVIPNSNFHQISNSSQQPNTP